MTLPLMNVESLLECAINSAIELGRLKAKCKDPFDEDLVNADGLLKYNERKLMKRILSEEDFQTWERSRQ